jgi:hypothetical protein
MMPGQPYKKLSPLPKAPYRILTERGNKGEATEDEFRAMLKHGTEVRNKAVPPAQVVAP